jgi:formylglycine-generating enzyme required for sulfatase activity
MQNDWKAAVGVILVGFVLCAACAPPRPAETPAPNPNPGTTQVNPIDGLTYVWIPAGKFTMGCSPGDGDCTSDEEPAHPTDIPDGSWMGQTPVTVAAWKRYRAATGAKPLETSEDEWTHLNEAEGNDNLPVVLVNSLAADDFCKWAGGGLPSEDHWEYAARAGSTGPRYGDLEAIAWYVENSGKRRLNFAGLVPYSDSYKKRLYQNGNRPHPVAEKAPNAWGFYDMLGNVAQLTRTTRVTFSDGGMQVAFEDGYRGCSWFDAPKNCRVSWRPDKISRQLTDLVGFKTIGFRCEIGSGSFPKPKPAGR